MKSIRIKSEEEMFEFSKEYAKNLSSGLVVVVYGDLGVGKTTFVKGVIKSLGYKGNVKSPTYTLVEDYPFNNFNIYHFDLYRLTNPEELEWIGVRDYFNDNNICFIEWPEKAIGFLPDKVSKVFIEYLPIGRSVEFDEINFINHI